MVARPRKPKGPSNDAHRRRLPPEATGKEAAFIQRCKDARAEMVVTLTNGNVVRGVIEYFDLDMVKVTRPDGPHFFVRKADIRYMHEDTGG